MEKSLFITLLQQNYERMDLFFSGDVSASIKIPLAVQYTFSRETFIGSQFEDRIKKLQKEHPKQTFRELFSPVSSRSVLIYKICAHLALHKEPQQELQRLTTNEEFLLKAGFKPSAYQNIAALFLTDEAHAKRAKSLHDDMKKQHYFLTGKDDIPYAVLLTKRAGNNGTLAETMRSYYDVLTKKGFKSGEALQAMTQLLTLHDEVFQPLLVDYVVAMKEAFTKHGIKVKKKFYPYLALLALSAATTQVVDAIVEMEYELRELKMYALEPEYALMTATQFMLQDRVRNEMLVDFKDSLLFMQALDIIDFMQDISFWVMLDILDLFI